MLQKKNMQTQKYTRTHLSLIFFKKKIFKFLVANAIVLVLFGFITSFAHFYLNDFPLRETFYYFFDVDNERSIPTLYSVYLIQFSAVLLGIISFTVKKSQFTKFYRHWIVLSFIFFYLSFDEALSLHERMANPFKEINSWVIPVLFLVSIFYISYQRFISHLPKKIGRLFLISGAIYICGAAGMEIVGYGIASHKFFYLIVISLEELMEMIGISIFIYALLTYLNKHLLEIKIDIK